MPPPPKKEETDMSKENFAFQLGWSQVRNKDMKSVRKELMEALGVTTRAAFLARLKGDVEPKVSQAKAVEDVFAKYGVKNVWGVV